MYCFTFSEYGVLNLTIICTKYYNFNIYGIIAKAGEYMEVHEIPIPVVATIKVSKEGKSAVFDTTVIQTTDNKYIYVMPIRHDNKLVNFEGPGLVKEFRILTNEEEAYLWRNITISKFVEEGNLYLRIKTKSAGIKVSSWMDAPKSKVKFK